jgi:triosephosphate isomerase
MRKLIIANLKLNPVTAEEALKLARKIDKEPRHEAVVCPPPAFLALPLYPRLGSQDCFWVPVGAFTGQISPATLHALKVKYCIVGHSERRALGETDADIRKKIAALLDFGIRPVLCIGFGTTVEEDDLEVVDILKAQVKSALQGLSQESVAKIVVAYEPVWAISKGDSYKTKKIATPEHATKIAMYIKKKFGIKKVLYGGSVNSRNALSFLQEEYLDGLLIGSASLLPSDFNEIINMKV